MVVKFRLNGVPLWDFVVVVVFMGKSHEIFCRFWRIYIVIIKNFAPLRNFLKILK